MRISEIRIDEKFAKRLPDPPKAQQSALVQDIRLRGLIVPLVVTKDRLLLDGHRRLAAAKEAGLVEVPTRMVDVEGSMTWGEAFAIAMNLRRRHLTEAQRADLGSSLLRVERAEAKERHAAAVKTGGRGRKKTPPSVEGRVSRHEGESSARVAAAVGVSRSTIERVERVKKADPLLAKRMLDDEISVAGAAKKLKAREIHARGKAETSARPGVLRRLTDGAALFRTIYCDPPWQYDDEGARGGVESHYPTMSLKALAALPVGSLAHPDGCHLWLWTTWPKLREGAPLALLEAWGFRWVGEVVWVKPGTGVGQWLRPASEILILAVRGKIPLRRDNQRGLLEAVRGRHSEKPQAAYDLIEDLSPGPSVELFARRERKRWIRWGNEA